MLTSCIIDVPSLAATLFTHSNPYKPFLPLLQHSEDPIRLLTSSFLTNLISTMLASSTKSSTREEEALPNLYTYLSSLTKDQDSALQDIGVQGFSALLRTKRSREIFWNLRKETVDPIVDILRSAAGAKDNSSAALAGTSSSRNVEPSIAGGVGLQLLYHVLLVMWQLSFEGSLVGNDLES
jgi:V-type H+-transporting ATPase subunit H